MCKVFQVSKSGYYNWLNKEPSKRYLENEELTLTIHDIFKDSFESYGAPRIRVELLKKGYRISRPRVAKIMKKHNLFARRKRKFKATTDSNHDYPITPNLLNQEFRVSRENQVWVSDITYIETKQGWMYLTVIIDLFQRKVIAAWNGWSMSESLSTDDNIIPTWNMALKSNKIKDNLIFHSDRGSQYASYKFTHILKNHEQLVMQSMTGLPDSRKGNCRGRERLGQCGASHAVVESFFKSLKVEWVYKHSYELQSEAKLSIFQWIETWYNRKRIHSSLGYKTIVEFENEITPHKNVA